MLVFDPVQLDGAVPEDPEAAEGAGGGCCTGAGDSTSGESTSTSIWTPLAANRKIHLITTSLLSKISMASSLDSLTCLTGGSSLLGSDLLLRGGGGGAGAAFGC